MTKTSSTSELRIGSVALQTFYDLKNVTGNSGRIFDLEINESGYDPRYMIDILKRLGPLNRKVHLVVKTDSMRWRGRWYALLKLPLPEVYKIKGIKQMVKDRDLPKLKDRAEMRKDKYDGCNLEPASRNLPDHHCSPRQRQIEMARPR